MQEYISSVRILLKVANGRSLDRAITSADSPLSRQIAYGVLRNFYSLSASIEQLLTKPLADKHQDIELLLLAGIYSIEHLNRPAHASVNFAVEATVGLKKPWSKKLVNGVLRNYQRKRDAIREVLAADEEALTNHPDWLRQRILAAYPDKAAEIFAANQVEPPMTLRVNQQQVEVARYISMLEQQEQTARPGSLASMSLYLETPCGVDRLPGFADGLVSVQDEASQLIPDLLSLEAGQRVLDACAAPGGKTCAILEHEPGVQLTAIDLDPARCKSIHENLTRLKLNCQVEACDLMSFAAEAPFDRILLDAPCSATGIIRRHPDIKLLRQNEDVAKLVATQEELLEKAWSLLGTNGKLLYSTCSILPDENQQLIARFVANHPEACIEPLDIAAGITFPEGVQLLPTTNGTDGFFYARLTKTKS